jgi:endonuclease III
VSGPEGPFYPHTAEITEALVRRFGRSTLGNKKNPFNELLYIILSSRTPPESYQETYLSLRRGFSRADSIAEARPEYVVQAIQRGGLQHKKAHAITEIATRLKQRFGRVTLAPLREMSTEEAEEFLTSLPGVSVKTARCVLMYSLARPVFPVDVHCRRIACRLRWTPSEVYLTEQQMDELQQGVPGPLRRDLHVGMVLLGRHYCFPQDPSCTECPILDYCPTGRSRVLEQPEEADGCQDHPCHRGMDHLH